MNIEEDKLAITNTTTKLLFAIYEQLQDINKKLDKYVPKEEIKTQVKKGVKK